MPSPKTPKAELRSEIRKRKRLFTEAQLTAMSAEPIGRLLAHEQIRQAETILMYYSLPDEVYTHDAADALVQMGKKVLLPAVTGESTMQLHIYENAADLRCGAYGIMEPSGRVFSDLQKIDVAVVPGMAFDRHHHRMGRGKGYYDRFLPSIPQAYKIGICFQFQYIDSIPCTPLDISMDEVIVQSAAKTE